MPKTAGSRAWQYLRRNPRYAEAWREAAAEPAPDEPAPFPLRMQTEAERAAAAWGLLAWEDPVARDGPASPFWAEAPMVEGEASAAGEPGMVEVVRAPGARLSGLRLGGGALILKVEQGGAVAQVRIADGEGFDPEGGLAFRLTFGLDLTTRLTRIGDLWALAAGRPKKAAGRGMTRRCFWPWTVLSPATPIGA